MKKLIPILALFLTGCIKVDQPKGKKVKTSDNYSIKTIDSCEYIEFDYRVFDQRVYSLTHKGNCKYCLNRKK